jgi:ABC-2 type transport system ATP-binding protein
MRRRLDLALSLVHQPEVLFLDEPTTGLDPTSRLALWDEVRYLNRELGTTVLLTTQYLEEADQLAGRIAIIDGGRIVREGRPGDLKAAVGSATLRVEVPAGAEDNAAAAMAAFGETRPAPIGVVAIGLDGGAARMADVVRALDEIGVVPSGMELHLPSLDDVFADATGRRLEGAADAPADGADGLDGEGGAAAPSTNGGRKRGRRA